MLVENTREETLKTFLNGADTRISGKNLDDITTEMMEYVCDSLCKYPEMESDEESLAELCDGCRMGKFVCDILGR